MSGSVTPTVNQLIAEAVKDGALMATDSRATSRMNELIVGELVADAVSSGDKSAQNSRAASAMLNQIPATTVAADQASSSNMTKTDEPESQVLPHPTHEMAEDVVQMESLASVTPVMTDLVDTALNEGAKSAEVSRTASKMAGESLVHATETVTHSTPEIVITPTVGDLVSGTDKLAVYGCTVFYRSFITSQKLH